MIRQLQPEELSLTRKCAEAFFLESALPGKLDFDHWRGVWTNLMQRKIGAIFCYELEGEIKGILGVMFFPCTMTGELEALEGFWFMLPEHRGGIGAVKMLAAFIEEARARKCKRVKMVHLMKVNPEKASKIYEKMGFELLQQTYSLEL